MGRCIRLIDRRDNRAYLCQGMGIPAMGLLPPVHTMATDVYTRGLSGLYNEFAAVTYYVYGSPYFTLMLSYE